MYSLFIDNFINVLQSKKLRLKPNIQRWTPDFSLEKHTYMFYGEKMKRKFRWYELRLLRRLRFSQWHFLRSSLRAEGEAISNFEIPKH